ncbi:hypothetical protein MKK58_24335 [Methylobacterium sp. J-078]|uniref:hypothetical protein n=1 Tax=Methylobacterium sp. J-078 TaxID=2836657 RepID=UPI001FB95A93|nr:hypothetical protein [Methylobacterium sp. J-078]MCJ2047643.1 hypothetical protein [Methylobacterium sp. J-078]
MTFGNAAVQSIVDELADELDQDDFAPPPTPESASAAAAKARRDEAERKRIERARRRDKGLPDARVVDTAIVQALAAAFKAAGARAHMQRTGKLAGLTLDAEAIARAALKGLAGRDIAKDVRWQMIQARLFPQGR